MARTPSTPARRVLAPFTPGWIGWCMAAIAVAGTLVSCEGGDPTGGDADYALSLTPTTLTVAQGADGSTAVTITRQSFTGAVTLSLGGAPAGVTGVFAPAAPTGTTSTLTVSVGAAVAPGDYSLTVNGSGTAGNRTTPLTLAVTPAGGGIVTLDFSNCSAADRPAWLAYQDGNGPWIVATPVSNVYTFTIAGVRGGLTYVRTGVTTSTVAVQYYSQAEFGANAGLCPSPGTPKTVNGTVAGFAGAEVGRASLGGGSTFLFSQLVGFPNFEIGPVADGAQDLLVTHQPSFASLPDKAIIRRGLNLPNGGAIGATLDFGQPEAFAPITATITVTGLGAGETLTQAMSYQVASCQAAPLYVGQPVAGPAFTAAGIPVAQQVATDFHGLLVFAHDQATKMSRSTTQYYHTFGARLVALPAVFPTPTITSLGGPYKRLQAVYTLPADYQLSTSLAYNDQTATGKSVTIGATMAYLGGSAVTLALPDYSALPGWDNSWAPGAANPADWTVAGSGGNAAAGVCAEGAHAEFGVVSGTN